MVDLWQSRVLKSAEKICAIRGMSVVVCVKFLYGLVLEVVNVLIEVAKLIMKIILYVPEVCDFVVCEFRLY